MTDIIPKWLMKRYSLLWTAFKSRPFSYRKASKILKENDERRMNVIISSLRRHGWVRTEKDPKDTRRRIYYLKPPEKAVNEIAEEAGK